MEIETKDKKNMVYIGFRLSVKNLNRAQELAKQLGVSRNRLIQILIERAEIENEPVIEVILNA
jgi:flagellar basal body-associated protein FliL